MLQVRMGFVVSVNEIELTFPLTLGPIIFPPIDVMAPIQIGPETEIAYLDYSGILRNIPQQVREIYEIAVNITK